MFGVAGVVGPILGIYTCGKVFDKLGGYTGQKALPSICIAMTIGAAAAAFSVTQTNPYVTAGILIIEMFAGGFATPVITGMLLN